MWGLSEFGLLPIWTTPPTSANGRIIMKVIDLIKYLETLPRRTEVYVLRTHERGYSIDTRFEPLNIGVNTEFVDMRGNQFAKNKPYENDVDLYIGEN